MSNQVYEGFTSEQLEMLNQPLDSRLIKHRKGGGGKMLAYMNGKSVIDAANRIFGFGGWGYKVLSRSRESCGDEKKGIIEFYTCDIELYVVGAAFPFPGDGVGIVTSPFTVEMHEKARKDCVIDAVKRALRHYGDALGLALWDEDAYVAAPDGSLVQVKEVPINDGSKQPRRVIESGKGRKAITAGNPPLDEQIKQAKLRAQKMGLARDADEWAALLKACHVTIIQTAADLAKVNGHMTAVERHMQPAVQQ